MNDSNSNMFVDDLNSVITAKTESELIMKIQLEFKRIQDYLISHRMKLKLPD